MGKHDKHLESKNENKTCGHGGKQPASVKQLKELAKLQSTVTKLEAKTVKEKK